MTNSHNKEVYSARLKYLFIIPLFIALLAGSVEASAQSQPASPPPGGPPPPPPPDQLFKKINPFKKHNKDTSDNKKTSGNNSGADKTMATPAARPAGPPPPPNPLNLFKKKKKDTTKNGKS